MMSLLFELQVFGYEDDYGKDNNWGLDKPADGASDKDLKQA